jgi:hypothetical protein
MRTPWKTAANLENLKKLGARDNPISGHSGRISCSSLLNFKGLTRALISPIYGVRPVNMPGQTGPEDDQRS